MGTCPQKDQVSHLYHTAELNSRAIYYFLWVMGLGSGMKIMLHQGTMPGILRKPAGIARVLELGSPKPSLESFLQDWGARCLPQS